MIHKTSIQSPFTHFWAAMPRLEAREAAFDGQAACTRTSIADTKQPCLSTLLCATVKASS